jgi:hypothetical protein
MHANPTLRPFAERLRDRGKPAKVVIVAVMRKLLLLAWTLLRTRQAYAGTLRPRPLELIDDADHPCSPVPPPATTQPAGT